MERSHRNEITSSVGTSVNNLAISHDRSGHVRSLVDDVGIGTELLSSHERSVVGKRVYDADGNLVQRHFRESFTGTFLNPDTGRVALWTQHDTVIHNLAVPGDVTTGTLQISGLQPRVWTPGGGTILTDAGQALRDAASDEVLRTSAHHPFDNFYRLGDASALEALCAALT